MSKHNGILSLGEEQYRAAEGISKSDLDWIAPPRTPAHYLAKKLGMIETETTPAMRLGQIVHRAILEPDSADYVVKPAGMNFATKEGKEWRAAQTAPIITAEEAKMVVGIADAVNTHPAAKLLLAASRGNTEKCLFAEDDRGALRKGRVDALPQDSNIIVDLKTTSCADAMGGMETSMAKFRYHVQAAYYLDLCNMIEAAGQREKFVLICCEKEPPFAVAVYAIDDMAVEAGRLEYQRDLALVRHCEAEDNWPAYSKEILTLGLPAWYQKQIEAVL